MRYLFLALAALVSAQSSSILYPTTAASSATALASASGYSYAGCYNETTSLAAAGGVRAITGGKDGWILLRDEDLLPRFPPRGSDQRPPCSHLVQSENNTMTINACLAFCASGDNGVKMQFAGLEYGRECYCGPYLSAFSTSVNASRCNYACNGNASELCGGSLAISLYNLTSDSKTGKAWGLMPSSAAWYGSAAGVALLVAALL